MLKGYGEYKKIDLPWLSYIPVHWSINRNKHLLTEIDKKSISGNEELLSLSQYTGVTRKSDKINCKTGVRKAESLVGYKKVSENDIVMNIMLAWNGSTATSKYNGVISPAYAVFRAKEDVNPWYIHYSFKIPDVTNYFKSYSTGVIDSRLRLYPEVLLKLSSILPPINEQNQIVRYLDAKVSKINRLISAKKKEIALLKEHKQAIISRVVTKGLDENVEMKDSGVEWIGKIPKHWKTHKLRGLLTIVSVKNRSDLPLLSVVREKGVIIRDVGNKEENHNFIPDDLSKYKVITKNQFAINKMKAWQGSYGISSYEGIVSPAYFIFDIQFKNLEYFHYAIRSKIYVNFFARSSGGVRTGQWDLSLLKMKDIPFLIPSHSEQIKIVAYIKNMSEKIDREIKFVETEVQLLTEYKTRLISDVVTGKVDVRGIHVEDVPEVELIDEFDEEIVDEFDDETSEEENIE